MLRPTILLSLIAMLLSGCGEKTQAEKQEEERAALRTAKKKDAQEFYNDLATKYPDDPRAEQAKAKAKALEAPAK
jgi:hypothetical protein